MVSTATTLPPPPHARSRDVATIAQDWLSRPFAWAATIAAIAALQLALTLGHRPWLDEYQALQIALQSPDLHHLLRQLRYEGHPPLWYLLLRGAATIVPAWWVLAAVAAPMALAIQAIVLLRAPFARADRVLIATSAFVLFEYGAISRSLTLGVMLFLVAFAWRGRRWSWIALALLPQADLLFGALSAVLVVLAWRERRLWWPGVALWAVLAALAAWSVVPAPDMIPAFDTVGPVAGVGAWLNNLSILLLPIQANGIRPEWNNPLPLGLGAVAGPLFLAFAVRQTRGNQLHRVLLLGFLAFTAAFSIAVYPLAIRHLSLAALLLIVLVWRACEGGAAPDRLFRPWLVGLSLGGLLSAGMALALPFDTAPEAAQQIRRLGLERAHWLAFPDSRAQGVVALTGTSFDRIGPGCAQHFIHWNYRSRIRHVDQLTAALRQVTARYGRVHLLSDMPIAGGPTGFYTLLAAVPAGYDGQPFYLYAIRADLPMTALRAPPCVAGQRPLRLLPPGGA